MKKYWKTFEYIFVVVNAPILITVLSQIGIPEQFHVISIPTAISLGAWSALLAIYCHLKANESN